MNVSGCALRGRKVGDPLVGEGEEDRSSPVLPRDRLARQTSTGRNTRASGLKVLWT